MIDCPDKTPSRSSASSIRGIRYGFTAVIGVRIYPRADISHFDARSVQLDAQAFEGSRLNRLALEWHNTHPPPAGHARLPPMKAHKVAITRLRISRTKGPKLATCLAHWSGRLFENRKIIPFFRQRSRRDSCIGDYDVRHAKARFKFCGTSERDSPGSPSAVFGQHVPRQRIEQLNRASVRAPPTPRVARVVHNNAERSPMPLEAPLIHTRELGLHAHQSFSTYPCALGNQRSRQFEGFLILHQHLEPATTARAGTASIL